MTNPTQRKGRARTPIKRKVRVEWEALITLGLPHFAQSADNEMGWASLGLSICFPHELCYNCMCMCMCISLYSLTLSFTLFLSICCLLGNILHKQEPRAWSTLSY